MGYLDKVSMIQDEYRDLLRRKPGPEGPTLEEEVLHHGVESYGETAIVSLAMSITATHDPSGEVETDYKLVLRDSITILDHLDTLGLEIKAKS